MNDYRAYIQKNDQSQVEKDCVLNSYIEFLVDKHPERNKILKKLAAFNEDDSLMVLIAFLGFKLEQQTELLNGIALHNEKKYDVINQRIEAIDDKLKVMNDWVQSNDEKMSKDLKASLTIQKRLYSASKKETFVQKMISSIRFW